MYFKGPISHHPCPPSPKNEFNNSRPSLRVYNPNASMRNKTQNTQNVSNDSSSDESPVSSPHFTVEKMTLSISPRSPRFQSNSTDIFNTAYYKRHKQGPKLDESGSNPYFPVQPLTEEKIDQIKVMLKMTFNGNADNPNEKPFEMSVADDREIDNLLTRIEGHVQTLAPKYFQSSASLIPSSSASNSNSFTSSYRLSARGSQLPSPRSPRRLSSEVSPSPLSFSGFHSLQSSGDLKQKKKLRISRSPSADIEKYHIIDKNGNDELDRRIIELKGKLSKIAELVKSRVSSS